MIDNFDSFTHNLVAYFCELDCNIKVMRVNEIDRKAFSQALDRDHFEGIVVSPGSKSPDECRLCSAVVAQALGKVPVLGVCLGHQIVAQLLGATIKHDKPMHGKLTPIFTDGTGLFQNLPRHFNVVRYHSFVVSNKDLPPSLAVNARDKAGTIMAFSHRELPLFGIQFHPEAFLSEYGHELLRNFIDRCSSSKEEGHPPLIEASKALCPAGRQSEVAHEKN